MCGYMYVCIYTYLYVYMRYICNCICCLCFVTLQISFTTFGHFIKEYVGPYVFSLDSTCAPKITKIKIINHHSSLKAL